GPPVEVHALYDVSQDAVRLEWTAAASASPERVASVVAGRPWIMAAAPGAGGGVSVRLWLRPEGLSANLLLAAVAEAARFAALLNDGIAVKATPASELWVPADGPTADPPPKNESGPKQPLAPPFVRPTPIPREPAEDI